MLVHYRDLRSDAPEQVQWEDRLWVFEHEGEGLRFVEYPSVRFEDERGRFEEAGGEVQRVLGAWEPSEGQRAEIARGLEVNARSVVHERLDPTAQGFSSRRPGGFDSARYVTFESSLEVDLRGPAPRFVWSDQLGSSAAHALEGRTLYQGERIEEGGAIAGAYDRDGRRVGRFRMLPAGAPRGVAEPAPPAPGERPDRAAVEARLYRELGRQLGASDALPERFEGAREARAGLRARVREELERRYRDQGNDPRALAPEIERLAAAIERLYADEGRTRAEIGRMLEDGRLRP